MSRFLRKNFIRKMCNLAMKLTLRKWTRK